MSLRNFLKFEVMNDSISKGQSHIWKLNRTEECFSKINGARRSPQKPDLLMLITYVAALNCIE